MKRFISFAAAILAVCLVSCTGEADSGDFSDQETALIEKADSIMRVLTITDSTDNAILRAVSTDLSYKALLSEDYARLEELMVSTVTHPSQDGVGIAGPQVGLNRRVVAVQRFDREGEPFEVYPNIRIVWFSDSKAYGPEGCLSVPDMRGEVSRSQEIVIEYADMAALRHGKDDDIYGIPVKRDTISGFTAVIFQHEVDHLEGVLYIDRLLLTSTLQSHKKKGFHGHYWQNQGFYDNFSI